jgi:hypothetical protein
VQVWVPGLAVLGWGPDMVVLELDPDMAELGVAVVELGADRCSW